MAADVYYDTFYDLYGTGFPQAPLSLRTELALNGWTDVSTYCLQRDGTSPPVSITMGRGNEQASATPCSMTAQWNNRSGNLSPRNPTGQWYGLLGRNTPVRLSVPASGPSLRIADDAVSHASCPGSAGLECAADIDIRVDCDLDNWAPCLLAGQFFSTASMCWSLSLNGNGTVAFTWYDGSATNQASSVMPVPLGRGAVRAYFDPAATSGSPQVIFYTAATMAGSWTQLGTAVAITAADYAVTSASAGLTVGYSAIWAASALGAGQFGLQGRVYEVQLRNSTTLAADPVFSAQAAGAASFADAQGNTWTVSGSASIDDRSYRVHAECTTLPQRWDSTGTDVWTPVAAKGVLQRLQQGSSPLPSTMRRFAASSAAAGYWGRVLGYWPGEDNAGATQVGSGLPGGLAMAVSGTAAFQGQAGSKSADSQFASSAQLGQVQASSWIGSVPRTGVAGSVFALVYVPSGAAAGTVLSLDPVALVYSTASSGSLSMILGGGAGGQTPAITGINGVPLLVCMWDSAASTGAALTVIPLAGAQTAVQVVTSSGGYTPPGLGGAVQVNPGGVALGSTEVGHILAVTGSYTGPGASPYGAPSSYAPSGMAASVPPAQMVTAANAWLGETMGRRHLRLCAENGIAGRVYGYPDLTAVMGAQPVDTLANLLQYGELTDRGQIYEPAEALGVGYRTLGSLCSQAPAVILDYSAAQLGDGETVIEPTDDDQYTVNDPVVQRNNGSSAQAQITSGPLSIQAPPNGVGDYDTQVTTYGAWDKDLAGIASWIAWVGTCDEERWPVIPLHLGRPQLAALVPVIRDIRLGAYFQVENLLSQLPPGGVSQLLYGYSEFLGGFHWRLAWNGVPEAPYEVAVAGAAHAQTAGSQLHSGVPPGAATLSVDVTAGNLWTTSAGDFPFNILVSGELMTVTNITGSSSPQSLTVTRSGNGVVKAQLAGAAVTVANVPVAALAGNR